MDELLMALWLGFKLAYLFGMAAGFATFAIAGVCRWMKWAPINITVNVCQHDAESSAHVASKGA